MDDLKAKIDDLNNDEAKTNFGKIQSTTMGSFKGRNHTYFWRYCIHSIIGNMVNNI
tara:strand:+ start:503 stop:670 length:168 start_codon:yes stop_codon:yes gene_type:complete